MTVRINKQKINLREKLTEFEDKVNFDEVVRGLGDNTAPLILNKDGGNVGIGTSSPQSPLHVYNSKSSACRLYLQNLSSSDYFDTCIYSQHSDLVFDAGRNPRMRITSTGNVGIGTTNPGSLLEIKKDVTSGLGPVLNLTNYGGNYYCQGAINFVESGQSIRGQIRFETEPGANIGSALYYGTRSADGGVDDIFVIKNNGNVGIGTTNPLYSLDVYGFNKTIGITSTHADGTRITHASLETDASGYGSVNLFNNVGNPKVRIKSNADSYFNGGNVGIGTANPAVKLEVVNSASANIAQFSSTSSNLGGYILIQGSSEAGSAGDLFVGNGKSLVTGSSDASAAIRASTELLFSIGAVEKMRITSTGNVGIGTTNPSGELHIYGNNSSSPKLIIDSGSVSYASSISFTADSERAKITGGYDTGGGGYMLFNTDTAGGSDVARMRINNAGNVAIYSLAASADVVTNANKELTTSSDKRLKNDLGDCEYGLTEILQVYPKKYTWKEGSDDQQATVGFFAQDIYPIMPEAAPREAIQNENGEDDYKWGLNSQTIIAALVNATKEQQSIIEDLKSRIETLESK